MADYAAWGEATSRSLGWGAETFLSTYNDNRRHASAGMLDDSPVAGALLELARDGVAWSGSPAELYRAASKIAGDNPTGAPWPKSVHTFGAELRRLAPQIRLHGLSIHFERKHEGRIVTLKTGSD